MELTTNEKGAIAETFVNHVLTARGFTVFKPIHDFSPVDIIATKDFRTLLRISVKYRKLDENGTIRVDTDQVVNGKRVPCDRDKIDCWAVYTPDDHLVAFFNKEDLVSHKCMWRFKNALGVNRPNMKPVEEVLKYSIERILDTCQSG